MQYSIISIYPFCFNSFRKPKKFKRYQSTDMMWMRMNEFSRLYDGIIVNVFPDLLFSAYSAVFKTYEEMRSGDYKILP